MKHLNYPNIFVNLKHEMASFIWNVCILHSIPDGFFSPGILWSKWVKYPDDRNNRRFANWNLESFEAQVGPHMSTILPAKVFH